MERMREVLNEFMRFMNPHLRLCSALSQFIFSSFPPNRTDLFSRKREKKNIRSSTKRDKFVAIRVNRFVIRGRKRSLFEVSWPRYYKSP